MGYSRIKVLIVDDKEDILGLVHSCLVREGFNEKNIKLAQNGEGVRKKLSENAFDLVISDFDMPDVFGLDILDEMRSGEFHPDNINTPFVLMTSETLEKVKKMKKSFLFDLYIRKPLHINDFVNKIISLLAEKQAT